MFAAGHGRFSIGLISRETGTSYHVHLSETEAQLRVLHRRAC